MQLENKLFSENNLQSINKLQAILAQPKIAAKLQAFGDILLQWAKIHSLTGIKDSVSMREQIYDSLMPATFLQPFKTCIDIGSGAGFPALILACYYCESNFYLLEPRKKRVSFLENAIIKMGLENAKVIADCSYNVKNLKGDLITSRAVCKSDVLVRDSVHLLAENGHYLLYKGTNTSSEARLLYNMNVETFNHAYRTYIYANF